MLGLNTQSCHRAQQYPPSGQSDSACGKSRVRRNKPYWRPYEPVQWLRDGEGRLTRPELIPSQIRAELSNIKTYPSVGNLDAHQLPSVMREAETRGMAEKKQIICRPTFLECRPGTLNLLEKLIKNSHVYFSPETVLKGVKALQCPVRIENKTYSEIQFACFESHRACNKYKDGMEDGTLCLLATVTYEKVGCIHVTLQLVGYPKYTAFEQSLRCTDKRLETMVFNFTFVITNEQHIQPTRQVDSSLQGKGICKYVSHNMLSQLYDAIANPKVELSTKNSINIGTVKLAYPLYDYCLRGETPLRDVDPDTLSEEDIKGIERRVLDEVKIPIDKYGLLIAQAPHESVPLSRVLSQYKYRTEVIDPMRLPLAQQN